jgi:hypothetical protein
MNDEVPSPNQFSPMNPVETWIKALTKPNQEAYREIVNDPGASIGKAVLWLAAAGLLSGLFTGIVNWLFGTSAFSQISQFTDYDIPRMAGSFMSVITGAFGGLFGAIIGAFILIGLVHLVSRMLGGTGSFEKLFYSTAAFQAPMSLVTAVVSAIPFVNFCLSPLIGIYGIVLAVIANKATHEYDTGKAVIATLAPVLVIFLFCCCIVVLFGSVFSALLGPTVGDVFNNSWNNLMP